MEGSITTTTGDNVTVHTYTAPEQGLLVNTHLLELPSQVIAIDTQWALPYAQEVVEFAATLGKPITRLYVSHDHPDHFLGASAFGAPLYGLAATASAIEDHGDVAAANNHRQFGDFVADHAERIQHIVAPGEEVIDGVRVTFEEVDDAESKAQLVISLPDEQIVVAQDLVYHDVHLFVADRGFDAWTTAINELKDRPIIALLPGHGLPGGPELFDKVLDYLATARAALANASDGNELKAALIEHYPDYRGHVLLDIQNRYLYPPPEPATGTQPTDNQHTGAHDV